MPFAEDTGIDILGNMIESSILSPNRTLYGDLHNQGHNIISYIHDPDGRFLVSFQKCTEIINFAIFYPLN